MEAIGEAIVALVAAAVELLYWAACGVFFLLRAIFSRHHRERLRIEWRSGWKKRGGLLVSCAIWSFCLLVAGYIWIPAFARDSQEATPTVVFSESPPTLDADGAPSGDRVSVTLTLSSEDITRLKESKTVGEVVQILKEKTEVKKAKKAAEPGATDNPDDAQRLREDH